MTGGPEAAEGKESAYSLDGERILAGGRRLRFTNLWMGNVQLGTLEGNRSTVANSDLTPPFTSRRTSGGTFDVTPLPNPHLHLPSPGVVVGMK